MMMSPTLTPWASAAVPFEHALTTITLTPSIFFAAIETPSFFSASSTV
jgi:hypothetical protein